MAVTEPVLDRLLMASAVVQASHRATIGGHIQTWQTMDSETFVGNGNSLFYYY